MSMMKSKVEEKKIDVDSVVKYLTSAFQRATMNKGRANRDPKTGANEAYKLQSEFAHHLNEITRGPECMLTQNIAKTNEFLDKISR